LNDFCLTATESNAIDAARNLWQYCNILVPEASNCRSYNCS
jgi:hypothetical protein